MKTIGTILKEQRQKNNHTMIELAEKIGTSQSAISVLENDKRFPTEETLYKIGQALNMEQNDLKELVELRNSIARNTPNPYMKSYNYYSEPDKSVYEQTNDNLDKPESGAKKGWNDFVSINIYSDLKSKIFIKTDVNDEEISGPIKEILEESIKKVVTDLLKVNEAKLKEDVDRTIESYINELNFLVKKK